MRYTLPEGKTIYLPVRAFAPSSLEVGFSAGPIWGNDGVARVLQIYNKGSESWSSGVEILLREFPQDGLKQADGARLLSAGHFYKDEESGLNFSFEGEQRSSKGEIFNINLDGSYGLEVKPMRVLLIF